MLLLQRHPNSRFAPGAFAFPGGRVEPSDAGPDIEARCRGLGRVEAARQLPDVVPAERAIGFWVAALREAFEEAGILLAYGPDGRPVNAASLGGDARARCRENSATFGRLLTDLDMALATDRVAYWAHWITPEERPIRYDTRFFVAAAWPEQVAEPDGLEMVAARWIRPEDALAQAPGARAGAAAADAGDPRVPLRSSRRRCPPGGGARTGGPARPPAHRPGRQWRRAHPAPAGSRLVLRPGPRRRIG